MQLLTRNIWLTLAIWVALYVSDYSLTLYGARLYLEHGKRHITVKGSYELNPFYEKDVNALRRISPRFLVVLTVTSVLLLVAWWSASMLNGLDGYFPFVAGLLFLPEAAIHLRHVRNIDLYNTMKKADAVQGKIEYARWSALRGSSTELFASAGLFFFLYLMTGGWFLLGGTVGCLLIGINHRVQSERMVRAPTDGPVGDEPHQDQDVLEEEPGAQQEEP